MRIFLSPAKKMRQDTDSLPVSGLPALLPQTQILLEALQALPPEELKALWGCNDAIAEENIRRIAEMDLETGLTPAILSYDGIAFRYMAPSVFEDSHFAYVQQHLRILSGFYGVLRPMDGVRPYRLEMQAKLRAAGEKDLYRFWGRQLYEQVRDADGVFINLASKEYSRCIEAYLTPEDTMITCVFAQEAKGKLVQKATLAKMARGEMVRYMAEHRILDPREIQGFDRLGFRFRGDLSHPRQYIFVHTPQ